MAIALVQDDIGSIADGGTLAFGVNPSAGSLLVAAMRIGGTTVVVNGITDTLGNTWALAKRQTNTGADACEIWYAHSPSGGINTCTFDWSGASTVQVIIAEFSGFTNGLTTGPTNGAEQDATTAHVCGDITTTVADSLSIANYGFASAFGISARGDSFLALTGSTNRDTSYKIHTATELVNADVTTGANETSAGAIANFSETAGAGTVVKDMIMMGIIPFAR